MGFGGILQQYKGKTGFKITSFQKNRFINFSFEFIKTAVNMERTRPRNGRRQMAYTLIPPKRRKKEDQELNGLKEIYYAVAEEGLDEVGGNGWRKVATG
jgi:hypothetical protein